RLDADGVAGRGVGGGGADAEALALPDGEAVHAVVAGGLGARLGVDDRAGPGRDPGAEERAGVAGGDEADVVAVRLVGDPQPAGGGLGPDRGLRGVADREHRVRQLVAGEHREDVRLVLVRVDGPAQLTGDEPGVVAGADRVEAQRERLLQQRGELDPLVAPQARVGRAPLRVRGDEVVDDVLAEAGGEVPDVERDADHVGGPAGVGGVLARAAAAGAAAQGVGGLRQREVHAHHVVPCVDGSGRGHRRVDATAHRGEDPHRATAAPARRARSTTAPMTDATASTSAAVEVWPRENRSEPRAVASSAPIASSTWLGCVTPAVQADPVEHSMPWASSSMSRLSPSQPGNDRWALPGSRDGPPSMTPVPGSPLSVASGTAALIFATRSSRRAASAGARLGASPTEISTA